MMFNQQKGVHASNIFNWKWRGSSSLTTRLLNDVPPEIELSDYQKAPSVCSESPSVFLDGETLNTEPIDDLDLFFERIYRYYCEKGLRCIIINWIVELLSLAFTICFSGFFLLYVDWDGLRNAKCGMDAVESGIRPCDLSTEALHEYPLTPFTVPKAIIVGYLGIFSIYWIICFLRFFSQLKEIIKIRHFYINSLHVTGNEIRTLSWPLILEKVVQVQSLQQLCVVKNLSIHDIVMRLMRKENYLIGMLNKGVLAFPISRWIPGAGPAIRGGPNGVPHRLVLPKTLEWVLNWCILQSMFDRNFHIRRDFVSDPQTLKKRLMIVGLVLLLLSPFLVIFMLVYLFLRHAEQFYNHPSTALSRRWSNLSKWMFREFNEVDHLFKDRIKSSAICASDYLKQFPSPMLTIVAKFVSFVSGGFAAVLIIIAFLEESLLEGHIFGRNLLWYAAVFGAITAISRAAMVDELLVFDPQGTLSQVVQHTHYMPKRWRGKENTETVWLEFATLFQYTGMMLLEEMASIFITPYLLLFVIPKKADDILQFIMDFTVNLEGIGHVCSFSAFDFRNHGSKRYGSPFNQPRDKRSSQGKLEKSFMSFRRAYPSWEPSTDGKQYLASLELFVDQMLRSDRITTAQQQNLSFRRQDFDSKHFPYILDWYYTSHKNSGDIPLGHFVDPNESNRGDPSNLTRNEDTFNFDWEMQFQDRVGTNLEASTSDSLFQESILRHHDSTSTRQPHSTKSHWWARSQKPTRFLQTSFIEPPDFTRQFEGSTSYPLFLESTLQEHHDSNNDGHMQPATSDCCTRAQAQGPVPQTSFMEPPYFHQQPSQHWDGSCSDKGGEEVGQSIKWRNSRGFSRTFYANDDGDNDEDARDFDLPFDEVYRKSAESYFNNVDPFDIV